MTDTPPTDPADDDLLASLYLDGEATADERARVEADPQLLARVRSFEAIANDLNNVAPPPDLARMQISAALDVFDQQHAPAAETPPAATLSSVSSLSERRERKQAKGVPTWLSAAAALALVVGGLGFASTLGGQDSDESTAAPAMDVGADALESGASRTMDDSAGAEESADSAELMTESEAASTEVMEQEGEMMADDAADDGSDAAPEEAMEEEVSEADSDEPVAPPSPIPLDALDATTAAEYLGLLGDQPLQPIDASPCAESPLLEGLFGVDSFIEVVYEGRVSSLLVQAGVPSTAVIVGPTCEIELD